MTHVLRQADPLWSKKKLGSSTIGRVGCLATIYAQAVRALGVDDECTPVDIVERGSFRGAGMVQPDTANAMGLVSGDVTRADDVHRKMRDVLTDALADGAVVVMHVDHDSDKPDGDPEGDHFVLGLRINGEAIVFADPATGDEERMDLRMLSSTVMWGARPKQYVLRSVRPLHATG